ncbi:MAG: queuosine salvage family protein [SAR324 cluster bacterium]
MTDTAAAFELPGADPLGVLESTLPVVRGATHVRIVPPAIARFAASAQSAAPALPAEDALHCTWLPPRRFCNYLVALECLNFGFWDDEPRWRVAYGEGRHDGYWALAAALHRALRKDAVPLWDARWLAEADEGRLARVLRGEGRPVPLLAERARHLREAGEALLARWDGDFSRLIEAAGGDAVALVQRIAAELPSFRDEATWNGQTVRFWKRAQICVADLARLLPGDGPRAHPLGRLRGLERLTAFADYKVPQVLRGLGIVEYCPELARRVDAQEPLPAGSPEEVEIRSATVWACELAARELTLRRRGGVPVTAAEVDLRVWIAGQHAAGMKPYHRTRTVFY